MDKIEGFFDRGVLHPGHPPIVDFVTLATSSKTLKAGTVLTNSENGFVPADADDEDIPTAVLLEDVAAHSAETVQAQAVIHGMVVRSRLLDFSGEEEADASDTLAAKLPAAGIYLTQAGWSESNFR
ncbi:MAG: hypothetical protein J6Y93_03165 [Treponema sp.]|nr:hypothetical protein [Treponema sp.]